VSVLENIRKQLQNPRAKDPRLPLHKNKTKNAAHKGAVNRL